MVSGIWWLFWGEDVIEEIKEPLLLRLCVGRVTILRCILTDVQTNQAISASFASSTSYPLQLRISQLQGFLRLMLEPICLAHIKTRILCHRHSGIKVSSTLELLAKPSIIIELGKQGCELFF